MNTAGNRSNALTLRIALVGGDRVSLYALRLVLENRMEADVREYVSISDYVGARSFDGAGHTLISDIDSLNTDVTSLVNALDELDPVPGIIILSAHREMAGKAEQAGNVLFVVKADSPQRLLSAVERLRIRGIDAE